MALVECVPNFSEGRDAGKIDAIVEAIRNVPQVLLLDRTMDPDHHRSVVTFAGPPEAVIEAAVRAAGVAAREIDLTLHQGVHPRMGAADVIPFVPLEGLTLSNCVELAHRAGERIWREHGVPVYFYEEAAKRPERKNLERVRKGGFEGRRTELAQSPEWQPDLGDGYLHPTAGASIVGARPLLIAYNIHLNTNDLQVAQSIAKAIRHSSGGFRFVKALGLPLASRSQVQVSMNLTDFTQTPIFRVFEAVKREAARYGAAVTGSELIGLIPRAAWEAVADFYLQAENYLPERILENRLEAVRRERLELARQEIEALRSVAGNQVDRILSLLT